MSYANILLAIVHGMHVHLTSCQHILVCKTWKTHLATCICYIVAPNTCRNIIFGIINMHSVLVKKH